MIFLLFRFVKGYFPVLLAGILFVGSAAFLPSVDQGKSGVGAGYSPLPGLGDDPTFLSETESPDGLAPGAPGGTRTITSASGGGTTTLPGRGRGSCAGKTHQVMGDPYSPPCIEWEGSNGGATSRGVLPDKIVVSARLLNERGFQQTLAALAGAEILDEPKDIERTIKALVTFFNKNYQFYGRQIDMNFYSGAGSNLTELVGGGWAKAAEDAERVANEIKAFAEINGATAPFSDALYKRQVIAFGTPYLSRQWHLDRRPFNWSVSTDCTIVAEVAAELTVKQLAGKAATHAGGNLKNQNPRVIAGLAPENDWYRVCVDRADSIIDAQHGRSSIRAGGFDVLVNYKLHIESMSNQAAGVVSTLKNADATTILCGCDPIFPVFLSAKAAEQNYHPEWIVLGTAFTDVDIVGQLYNQNQWTRAFGVSSLGSPIPLRAGLGYAAYKTVRGDEPAFGVELIYGTLLELAVGIQMAGPDLNPLTFEQGMFKWPGGLGPYGRWKFGPQNYTPTQDYRVIWWDPDRISISNNKRGAYVESYGGQRFSPGNIPTGDPQVPIKP